MRPTRRSPSIGPSTCTWARCGTSWATTPTTRGSSPRCAGWDTSCCEGEGGVRRSLFWTLLGINLLVVGVAVGLAALMIGRLADAIFASLMKEFHIQADIPHHMFATALWHSLLVASLAARGGGGLLNIILFRPAGRPRTRVMAVAGRVARGGYC